MVALRASFVGKNDFYKLSHKILRAHSKVQDNSVDQTITWVLKRYTRDLKGYIIRQELLGDYTEIISPQ